MPLGSFAPLPLRLGGSTEEGWAPAQHARFCADLVAVKRVTPLAVWSFSQDSGSPYAVTMLHYFGQNGVGLAYAPTATVNGLGDVSFAFSVPYFTDEYGVQEPWKIRHVTARNHDNASVDGAFTTATMINRGVRVRFSRDGSNASGVVCVKVW